MLLKKKQLRSNHKSLINKDIRKATMHRPKLRNKYYKVPSDENFNTYKRQGNIKLTKGMLS